MNSLEGLPKSASGVLLDGSPAPANISKGQDEGAAPLGGPWGGDFAELLSSLAVADEKGQSASRASSCAIAARGASSDGEQADLEGGIRPETDAAFRRTIAAAPSLFSRLSEFTLKDRAVEGAEAAFSDEAKSAAVRRTDADTVDPTLACLGQGGVGATSAVVDLAGSGDPVRQSEIASRSRPSGPAPKQALETPLDFPAAAALDSGHNFVGAQGPRLEPWRKTPIAPTEAVIAPVFPFNLQQSAGGDVAGGEVAFPDLPVSALAVAPAERLPWRIGERPGDVLRQASPDAPPDAIGARQAESSLGANRRGLAQSDAIRSAGRNSEISFAAAGKISILDKQTFLPPAASPSLANQLALLIGAEAAAFTAAPNAINDPSVFGRPADAPAAPGATPVKILTLQLQPESLGIVTVRMRLSGAQLDLQVEATNPNAIRLIDGDRDLLAQRLRALGISMEALVIKTAESTSHAPAGVHYAQGGPSASQVPSEPSSPSTPQHGEFARHERSARAKDDEPVRRGPTGAVQGVGDGRSSGELYI